MNDLSDDIDALNSLNSRLHQSGTLCIVPELIDELLDMANLVELAFTSSLCIFVLLSLCLLELLEVTLVVGNFLCLEVHNFLDSRIQEVTCVRNYDHSRIIKLLNIIL